MQMKVLIVLAMAACIASGQRLVTLNISARDAQGHAVTDLTATELEITDQGRRRRSLGFAMRRCDRPRWLAKFPIVPRRRYRRFR